MGKDAERLLGDALDSVRKGADGACQGIDDDGAVVLARDYSLFGPVCLESGTGSSGYGYAGEQHAGYTQFVFLSAR